MADQPRNLDPALDAFDHTLTFGMLLFIPDYNSTDRSYRSLRFQYNPETLTRTREGEWTSDRVRGAAKTLSKQDQSLLAGHRGGGLYAKSETVSFKLLFDAAELVLRGDTAHPNVMPELAFLEQVALGGDEALETEKKTPVKPPPNPVKEASAPKPGAPKKPDQKPSYKTRIQGTAPSELLLVLGPRTLPVVLTSLTITEQRFNPELAPIRAECDCKFRILETQEVRHNKPAQVAFTELLKQRRDLAAEAEKSADAKLVQTIANALENNG